MNETSTTDLPVCFNVKKLPVAYNVCEQVLREVETQPAWSLAHVIMNPFASSLLHHHEKMDEIYVITRGFGELGFDMHGSGGSRTSAAAGSVFRIPKKHSHQLTNKCSGHLEHLVLAFPPFDPKDVHEDKFLPGMHGPRAVSLPNPQECFDGAKILSYDFSEHDISIAFGWVINEAARRKKPHYHKRTMEFIYVVEGKGFISLDGKLDSIEAGDWIRIPAGISHNLINESPEDMVVLAVCSPQFTMEDVHYRD